MINKERFDHPKRYEVTIFDTAEEKVSAEFQCYGSIVGIFKKHLTESGGVYTTAQPFGVNFDAQDVATLVYSLLESYPEAKVILDQTFFHVVDDGSEGEYEDDSQDND